MLADPDHEAAGLGLFHQLPATMAALPAIAESFRTGIGHDYDSCGAEGAIGGERGFEPWNRAHLLRRRRARCSTVPPSAWTPAAQSPTSGAGRAGP